MIISDVKSTIKNPNGFNSFYTTLIIHKNTQNIGVLSSIKPFMCICGYSQAYITSNYAKIPYFYLNCYNNAITYFKRSSVKCI